MKEGYARVSEKAPTSTSGKIRKIRCRCTNPKGQDGLKLGTNFSYFNYNETGFPANPDNPHMTDRCPVCQRYAWYTI